MNTDRRLRITTTPGLEDLAAAEVTECLTSAGITQFTITEKPNRLAGNIGLTSPVTLEDFVDALRECRSIQHIVQEYAATAMEQGFGPDDVAAWVAGLELPIARDDRSFRASCRRVGTHAFTSPDVERAVGTVIHESYGLPVDLTGYETEIRVDIVGVDCFVGRQLTRETLDRRFAWVYRPRVTLRTNIAYCLLIMARLTGTETVLDPFCGSGTIPIEAAAAFPNLRILASDRSDEAVEGARANATAAGIAHRIEFSRLDVFELSRAHAPGAIDSIVTDPPIGVRLGRNMDFLGFYRRFLCQAFVVLKPGGRIVLLTGRRRRLIQAIDEHGGFDTVHVRVIETGGLYTRVFVLSRRA